MTLSAAELDLLNSIGVGEMLATTAAAEQRCLAEERMAHRAC